MAIDDIIDKIGYRSFVYRIPHSSSFFNDERWTFHSTAVRIQCTVHQCTPVHIIRSQLQYLFLRKVLFIQFCVHERALFIILFITGNISNERQLIRLFTFNFWLKFNSCECIVEMFNVHWTIQLPTTTTTIWWGWLCLRLYLNYEFIIEFSSLEHSSEWIDGKNEIKIIHRTNYRGNQIARNLKVLPQNSHFKRKW